MYITESQPLSKLVVPELRSGNEVSSGEEQRKFTYSLRTSHVRTVVN